MGFPLAEIIRIAAAPVGLITGPAGALIAPGMLALANSLDKEDSAPEAVRKMKERRRKDWIEFAVKLEKEKLDKLKKYPDAARPAISAALGTAAGADLRAVIKGEIYETENRIPDDQEVNLLAEAVSARAREKA